MRATKRHRLRTFIVVAVDREEVRHTHAVPAAQRVDRQRGGVRPIALQVAVVHGQSGCAVW